MNSQVSYGVEIYANCSKTVLDRLCKLNNKLIRILFDKKIDTPVKELYSEHNILPITLLHEYNIITLIFKCCYYKHEVPKIFQHYFVKTNMLHDHYTRGNDSLYTKPFSTSWGKKAYCTMGVYFGTTSHQTLNNFHPSQRLEIILKNICTSETIMCKCV